MNENPSVAIQVELKVKKMAETQNFTCDLASDLHTSYEIQGIISFPVENKSLELRIKVM